MNTVFRSIVFSALLSVFIAAPVQASSISVADSILKLWDTDYATISTNRPAKYIGDIDGDGYDDFAFGAYSDDSVVTNSGSMYLVYGNSSAFSADRAPSVSDLTGDGIVDIARFNGNGGETLGYALDGIGDFDGDGFDDMIVSSPFHSSTGEVHIIFGNAERYSGTVVVGLDSGDQVGDEENDILSLTGQLNYSIGYSVAGAGDFNNDGFDDFLVGSTLGDSAFTNSGTAYLVYGAAIRDSFFTVLEPGTDFDEDGNSNVIEWSPEATGDGLGYTVEGIGYFNDDAYSDVAISAYLNDDGGSFAGAVYIVYGGAGFYDDAATLDGGADLNSDGAGDVFQLNGDTMDIIGIDIAGGQDVDGDGQDDLLIGNSQASVPDPADPARVFSGAGTVFLVYGATDAYTGTADFEPSADFNADGVDDTVQFEGAAPLVRVGEAVTFVPDINGDGAVDMVIGSYADGTAGSQAGSVYYVYGPGSRIASGAYALVDGVDIYGDSTGDIQQILGEAAGDQLGQIIGYAGDINGDGYGEVLVGAPGQDAGGEDEGATYVLYYAIDADGDGELSPDGLIKRGSDCNDHDAAIQEKQTYYADADGDGLGAASDSVFVCSASAPKGYVDNALDANDNDFDNDGVATAVDCNDEDATVSQSTTYYRDSDADGKGDPANAIVQCSNDAPAGYVSNNNDVVGEVEIQSVSLLSYDIGGDGIDNDGDGEIDEVNTGMHPTYGLMDANDADVHDTAITSVESQESGYIHVTYKDGSVFEYSVFAKYSKPKLSNLVQWRSKSYYAVVHPFGKSVKLVNVLNGEVVDTQKLGKKKWKQNGVKVLDVRTDGSRQLVVTSKNNRTNNKPNRVRVVVLNVKPAKENIIKKGSATFNAGKARVGKTTVTGNRIRVRKKNGTNVDVNVQARKNLSLFMTPQ